MIFGFEKTDHISTGFREGRMPPPPSGIRPPADPKGTPFVLFWDIHFWMTDLKLF